MRAEAAAITRASYHARALLVAIMHRRVRPFEALGLDPLGLRLREALLAVRGDSTVPPTKFGVSRAPNGLNTSSCLRIRDHDLPQHVEVFEVLDRAGPSQVEDVLPDSAIARNRPLAIGDTGKGVLDRDALSKSRTA